MDETLNPLERIRKKRDFESIYSRGKRFRGKYITLIYLSKDESHHSRMSAVVSKRHGNAVRRNKIKRQLRTLFRRNKALITNPLDLIVIPGRELRSASWAGIEDDYRRALRYICSTG